MNCCDNAVVESFFSSKQSELDSRTVWTTRQDARQAIYDYIEVFHNRKRRHAHNQYLSPATFERLAKTVESMAT